MATKRIYGKERTLGDIIYNPATNSTFTTINLGFFGKKSFALVEQNDGFDIMVKTNSEELVKIGKTFLAKKQDGTLINGVTKGTLGLLKRYNSELRKEVTDNSDALFISTHLLKEAKPIGNDGLLKIGFLKGVFGLEIESNEVPNETQTPTPTQKKSNIPAINIDDIDEDELPF